jgi:hypothetical protein
MTLVELKSKLEYTFNMAGSYIYFNFETTPPISNVSIIITNTLMIDFLEDI